MQETNLPPDSFVNHMENFHLNLDKICIVENDGSLMIIGGSNRKKHEKRLYESRLSLTLIRIGNDDGNEVPWIFLYKVNSNPNKSLSDAELVYQYGAPDLFQTKTDLFSTRALIWVHFKTVHYFYQPIFSLFSYLKMHYTI